MDHLQPTSSLYLANKRWFTTFLDDTTFDYASRVRQLLTTESTRLTLNLNDLRAYDNDFCNKFIKEPLVYIAPFEAALNEYVRQMRDAVSLVESYHIGIDGSIGANRLSPRSLTATHLSALVQVDGIATKCSSVRPKVTRTVHFCQSTKEHTDMTYHDATSLTGLPTSSVYPTKDTAGNPLTTEFGLSTYNDHQTFTIQEMPERAPAGLLPSAIDVILDGDLVDTCKPGDRVSVIGIYRALPSKQGYETMAVFRSVLIALTVKPLTRAGAAQTNDFPSAEEIKLIRDMAKRSDLFTLLSQSIAPSIFGQSHIKRALLLQLFGGVEKNLDNGTHIRGDINVLMVGDPSTAKSQLLRFILHIAPLALNTTGRGSSGVGLTAAVSVDKDTGDRRLEAGAMVLADRGIVCIDEFDKMSDADRVAIHEAMEQQTVTIAKAGIHMSLNARCSVLAAANPRYSQYDATRSPAFNVNLPDSLLSRFDLLFIVLDNADMQTDKLIADRVLNNHRYFHKVTDADDDDAAPDDANDADGNDGAATRVFEKYDVLLHGAGRRQRQQIVSIPFMKKYIQFAKVRYDDPRLTVEAAEFLGEQYAQLRHREAAKKDSSYPVTARCLETLIRLSSAHAKMRLSEDVDVTDCEVALQVLRSAIDHDLTITKRKRKRENRGAAGDDDEDDDDDDDGNVDDEAVHRTDADVVMAVDEEKAPTDEAERIAHSDNMSLDEAEHKYDPPQTTTAAATTDTTIIPTNDTSSSSSVVDVTRLRQFKSRLVSLFKYQTQITVNEFISALNDGLTESNKFSRQEIESIWQLLEEENRIMVKDGIIYRID